MPDSPAVLLNAPAALTAMFAAYQAHAHAAVLGSYILTAIQARVAGEKDIEERCVSSATRVGISLANWTLITDECLRPALEAVADA